MYIDQGGTMRGFLESITTSARSYMKYTWGVLGFIFETVFSKVPIIVCICAAWTWYARKYEPEYINKDDISMMHSAITGILTFLLAMRLNNALSANRTGFDGYCTACGYLEMFQQRLIMSKPSERTIMDLIVFLPLVIKHELRGDYNIKQMDISDYYDGDEDSSGWSTYDGPTTLREVIRPSSRYNDPGPGVNIETHDLLRGIHKFDNHFSERERIETMVLYKLKEEGLWVENIMVAWTQYRNASAAIGGSLGYTPPISFSFIVWLTLAMYIYSMPYMIPTSSTITSATATATVSATCLLLLHLNANRIANPFKSSNTFQTVTHAGHACTRNLLTTVGLFRKHGTKKGSSLNL